MKMSKYINNIICLMGLFPESRYDSIITGSKGNIQYAADALQKAIISGLAQWNNNITIVNLPFIGGYPQRYSQIFSPSYPFVFETPMGPINGYNVPFCNLSIFKLWSRYRQTKKYLLHNMRGMEGVILVYSIHTPFLKACVEVKKSNKNLKILLVVPDLPEFMSQESNPIRNFLQFFNQRTLEGLYKYVDGYVLLSEFMTDRLPVNDKPWAVVEGIFNKLDEKIMATEDQAKFGKYVLYTGTLAKRYGIMNLVEAFHNLPMQDVELYICGDGDSKSEIIDFAKRDSRIVYKGLVRREYAMALQKNALLLVNPRAPEGEFTKYSFPSKTMEYLASGIPTLLYRLPGIPNEYYDYCYSLTDLSIEALTKKLEEIILTDAEELQALGSRARNFILEKKNPKQQTKKIIDLINKL